MKIYLETYGCTANKSDESIIKGLLTKKNHCFTQDIDDADILILLTCTVIDTTEQRMLSRLKIYRKTGKPIIVTGCMIPLQQEKITAILPTARLLPPRYIHHIDEILYNKNIIFREQNKTLLPKQYTDVIAPIAIAEGCQLSCSYCITHFTRGSLRSFPRQEIIADVKQALASGCKEIQLTAQDTASYGLDTKESLFTLLKDVTNLSGEFRVRLGMMNPFTVKKNIDSLQYIYSLPKVYKFLHLPIQTADNDLLQKMNRLYSVEDFLEIIKVFKTHNPMLTLSTDIIVGFPTETDAQFKKTVTLLQHIKPDIINITRYSARPYTTAKTMNGRIPTEIVKERSKKLTQICKKISEAKNKQLVGKHYTILVTERGKNKTSMGRTEDYKPVIIKEQKQLGELVNVEIIKDAPTYLFGKLI